MAKNDNFSETIEAFNKLFDIAPPGRSFQFGAKFYISEKARAMEREFQANTKGAEPVVLASYGFVPDERELLTCSRRAARSSSSSSSGGPATLRSKKADITWKAGISKSDAERICDDNAVRKKRSMVDLVEFNKMLGLPYRELPEKPKTPDTVYENLHVKTPTTTISYTDHSGSEDEDGNIHVSVASVFD